VSGHELRIAIVADTSRADMRRPADQLDDLADAAQDTDRALDRLDTAARDTERALDRAGTATRDLRRGLDQVAAGARDADRALDKVDATTRTTTRGFEQAGHAAGGARQRIADVADEAHETARETAASFSTLSGSLADMGQEMAANIGGMFGPIGLGIGAAISAGIALYSQRMAELKQQADALFADVLDTGGAVTSSLVRKHLEDMGSGIVEFARIARDARVPVSDFLAAVAGDQPAIDRTTKALEAQWSQMLEATNALDDNGAALADYMAKQAAAKRAIGQNAEATQLATEAYAAYAAAAASASTANDKAAKAAATARDAVEQYGQALDTFVDPANTYEDLLTGLERAEHDRAQATADATANSKDSWADYVQDVTVSLDAYTAQLADQVTAQEDWARNMRILAGRVSATTLAELAKMGPRGAQLVQQLVTAADDKVAALDDVMRRRAAAANQSFAGALGQTGPTVAAAGQLTAAVQRALTGKPVVMPVGFDDAAAIAKARALAARIQAIVNGEGQGQSHKYVP
jgi:chromosome segregation ATPase